MLGLITAVSAGAQPVEPRNPIRIVLPKRSALVYQNGYIGRFYAPNVKVQQQEMVLFSDRALYRDSTNELTASGHVLLVQADSVVVRADTIHYRGDERLATLRGRVTFQHHRVFLTASQLDYNLSTATVHYGTRTRIADGKAVMSSTEGYYNTRSRRFTNQSDNWLAHSGNDAGPAAPARLAVATGGPDRDDDSLFRKLSVGPVADVTFAKSAGLVARSAARSRPPVGRVTTAVPKPQPAARSEAAPTEPAPPGRMLVRAGREVIAEPVSTVPPADTTVSELERILNGRKRYY